MKIKETNPNRLALCVMLAGGNHTAGALLERAVYWKQYGAAAIPNVEGKWIANPRLWWMREAHLSSAQYDRASAKLQDQGLIEKRQWWFGRRCILFLRPTLYTMNFLAASSTWQAAQELLADEDFMISNFAKLSSADSLNSNGFIDFEEAGVAVLPNPNNINTTHPNLTEEEVCIFAHQASPSCTKPNGKTKKEAPGKKKKGNASASKSAGQVDWSVPMISPVTVKSMRKAWHVGMQKYHTEAVTSVPNVFEFAPQEWKGLAQILQSLKYIEDPDGKKIDLQANAIDILLYALLNWSSLAKSGASPKYPSVGFINEQLLAEVVGAWDQAGRPPHVLDGI